jgi:hypothetical protein
MFFRKHIRTLAALAAAVAIAGGTYGIVSATATSSPSTTTTVVTGRPGSNARSGPAAGGSTGMVASLTKSGFTLTTSAAQKVTVTSATVVKKGENVLVLGTTSGTTITAGQVIVLPEPLTSAAVVPFQRGTRSTAKEIGQIPASYSQGSGTIVGGTQASKAAEAALTTYPGGVVDRVVKLSDGEYEVHNIGVNWPHHIFVNQSFKVVGAD